MKNQRFGLKALVCSTFSLLGLLLFGSCARPTEDMMNTTLGGVVRVSFADRSAQVHASRAFFDPTDRGEAWEETLHSLTICAFYPDGTPIVQRIFSSEELANKSCAFALPDVVEGTVCSFYAVANRSLGLVGSRQELLGLIENNPSDYNGTFGQISSAAKRAEGFVMSGSTTATVSTISPTDVVLTLSRTVAKVAIEATPSPAFGSLYPGVLRVDQITVRNAATQSPVVQQALAGYGSMSYSYTQSSTPWENRYRNLFYLFSNNAQAEGNRVALVVEATYDADGDLATPQNQAPMRYEIELEGDGSGALLRNGYYRVAIAINGLEGSDATVSFSVAPWRTPSTQYVHVGM